MGIQINRDRGTMVIGAILVVLGLLLFGGQLLGINLARFTWPFFIIIPGLAFFVGMVMGGKDAAPLAIPGSIITTVGLLLFYQTITNHWESWAYAWALIVSAVGVGLVIGGTYGDQPRMVDAGRRVAIIGLVMLVIGWAFFELIIGISGYGGFLRTIGGPAALIILGLAMLLGRMGLGRRAARPAERDKPAEER